MQGKAIVCRMRTGAKGAVGCMATQRDAARLREARALALRGRFRRALRRSSATTWTGSASSASRARPIGLFENEWNDFDRLTPATRLLHNTKRQTQPWKTGLPVDFTPARKKLKLLHPATWLRPLERLRPARRSAATRGIPIRNQERLFFGLLRECLERGIVSEDLLREEMRQNHVRHDAFQVLERTASHAA